MRPFSQGISMLIHGFYTLLWVGIVLDVGSPTFQLHLPAWSFGEAAVAAAVLFTAAAALGVVMHTISRNVFHGQKQIWAFEVLTSSTVQQRFATMGPMGTFPGGPTYEEAIKAEGADRIPKAGGFLHAVDYQLQVRAPVVWQAIQSYRDQYRLARGFVIPSAAFAPVLPLWDPVAALDTAGAIGPFPIIRTQLFLLAILASAVCFVSFRERTHRYAAAQLIAYATLEGERAKGRPI